MRDKRDKDGNPVPLSVEEQRVYVTALQKWKDSRHGRKDTRQPNQVQVNIQQNLSVVEKECMIKDLIGGCDDED